MTNLIQDFKDNCSNFLYIFIKDNAVSYFQKNGGSVILQKRQNQIAYVTKAAQMSKYSYQELEDAIAEEITAVYGKKPGEILINIAEGKNVYSLKDVRKNISGIGACRVGAIDDLGYPKGKDKNKYATVWDAENNIAVGRFDLSTGKQVSYYDTKTNTWKKGATPSTDENSRNMWVNNIDWNNLITTIINLIGSLFGVKQAQNLASYQSDGWYGVTQNTTQNSTNNILPIALLAVAGYYLVVKEE